MLLIAGYLIIALGITIGVSWGKIDQWYAPDFGEIIKSITFGLIVGIFFPISFFVWVGKNAVS